MYTHEDETNINNKVFKSKYEGDIGKEDKSANFLWVTHCYTHY